MPMHQLNLAGSKAPNLRVAQVYDCPKGSTWRCLPPKHSLLVKFCKQLKIKSLCRWQTNSFRKPLCFDILRFDNCFKMIVFLLMIWYGHREWMNHFILRRCHTKLPWLRATLLWAPIYYNNRRVLYRSCINGLLVKSMRMAIGWDGQLGRAGPNHVSIAISHTMAAHSTKEGNTKTDNTINFYACVLVLWSLSHHSTT